MTPGVEVQVPRLRSGVRVAAIASIAALLLAAAGLAATKSSLFAATTIRVHGASHFTRTDVLRIAGITEGTNVFYMDTGAVERRLERNAWVAGATITKELPSTVVVAVRERVAVAVTDVGGSSHLVAEDGTVLDAAGSGALLPAITPVSGQPALSSSAIRGAAEAIAAMVSDVRRLVSSVTVLSDGELVVNLSAGAIVTYGPAEELAAKATALGAVLRWADGRGVRLASIDVRVPTDPTARLGSGAPVSP